jgi:hypothetical protein
VLHEKVLGEAQAAARRRTNQPSFSFFGQKIEDDHLF